MVQIQQSLLQTFRAIGVIQFRFHHYGASHQVDSPRKPQQRRYFSAKISSRLDANPREFIFRDSRQGHSLTSSWL